MLKNPNYIYGPQDMAVPVTLNFGDFILGKMWESKNKVAMINGATGERITYSEIVQSSMNFAISLTRMGVKKGDTIAIFAENRMEYWGAVIGVACAGGVLTTISTAYVKGEIIHVMNISKPKYIICSPTTYKTHGNTLKSFNFLKTIITFGTEKFPNVINYDTLAKPGVNTVKYEQFSSVEVQGQRDPLLILYSSGTTGLPKGVMLTHLNVISACSLPPSHNPNESTFTIGPWYHVMGLNGTLAGLSLGRTMVYLPKFDVELYLNIIEKYKVSQLTVVPPVLVAICKYQSNHDLSSVKRIYSGAAPLTKDTIRSVHAKFPNVRAVYQGYGSTEVTLGVIRYNYDDVTNKPGSVGKVVNNTIVKVVDVNSGKPLGPNQAGEICFKGCILMKGYVGKPKADDFDDEGFYKSGDIGYYDEDGYFFIIDRLKELIKYKGYQVPPAELEGVLLQHEGIKDAAVIGIEDKSAGEVPLAFVVLQPGYYTSEKEIKDFVAARLSTPKHLRGGVRFVDQIPKAPSGKILRKDLKKMLNNPKSKL